MKKQSQNGSALLVIIIILVVAILGTLGFVLWQHLKPAISSPVQSTSENKIKPPVKLKTAQIDASFPAKLSWSYPETWTIKSEGSGPAQPSDTTTQKFTLTSPSTKYEVIYYVGLNGGLGGACEPGADVLQSIKIAAVSGFQKGVLLEDTHGSPQEGFTYSSGLFKNNSDVLNAKAGDSVCNVYLRDVIPLTDDGKMVILAAQVDIKQFDSTDQYGPTKIYPKDATIIEKAFDDPEYKDAVNILLSTVSN